MSEPICAGRLLRRAREVFDAPTSPLPASAARAWRAGFASGGRWMHQALEHLRGAPLAGSERDLNNLGLAKYALAGAAALATLALAALVHPVLAILCLPCFYAVEAQMVFLFPVALDGSRTPFHDARRWTIRAGGTLAVMRVVLPLAFTMVLGGFAGGGFVRSWCLGCLAVCIWYEDLRGREKMGAVRARPSLLAGVRAGFPLQIGSFGPLHVRREEVRLGLCQPWRILYASDLHLGHWWTRPVVAQLLAAVDEAAPELILLGGDLADSRAALPDVDTLIRALAARAPVFAIPGNHDPVAGSPSLRATVEQAGGVWLPDHPLDGPARIDGAVCTTSSSRTRILCAHYPSIFPAAIDAGYRLVLAGHLHGGQCVLGTHRGRLYPAAWVHRWHGLRFEQQGATMLVSRGMGDTLPLRFNCPAEVLLCVLS